MKVVLASLIGLLTMVMVLFSLGIMTNTTVDLKLMEKVYKDPVNLLIVFSAAIGFASFFKKLLHDAYKWFSTGLNSKSGI